MPIVATSANSLNTTTTGIKLPTPFEKISNPISSSSTKETKIEHISHQHVIADPTIVESTSSDTISTQSPSNNTQQTIKRKKVVDDELDAEEDTYKAYVQDDFDNVSNLNVILSNSWRTTNSSTNLKLLLDNFGFHDNLYNVLVLRIIIPTAQAHWSISISPTDDMDNQDIFLQIAQRYRQKKDIIDMSLNDKIYSWGNADKRQWKPTSRSTMLLAVIIRQEAFYIFFDDKLQFSFPHRRDISLLNKLSLVVPIVDDNMKSEDLIVQRVWWGSYNNNILQKLLIPPESIEKNAFQYKENLNNLKIRNNNPFYLTLVVNGLPPLINESDLLDVETLILQMLKQQGLECKTMNISKFYALSYLKEIIIYTTRSSK